MALTRSRAGSKVGARGGSWEVGVEGNYSRALLGSVALAVAVAAAVARIKYLQFG